MGIICVFIGMPVTLILLSLGVLIIVLGQYLYKRKSNIARLILLYLTYIPMSIVCALYLGGIYEAMKYSLLNEGIHSIFDPSLLLFSSILVGTFNVIEPGSVLMGGNGPTVNTEQATSWSLLAMLVLSLILVIRFYKKIIKANT